MWNSLREQSILNDTVESQLSRSTKSGKTLPLPAGIDIGKYIETRCKLSQDDGVGPKQITAEISNTDHSEFESQISEQKAFAQVDSDDGW